MAHKCKGLDTVGLIREAKLVLSTWCSSRQAQSADIYDTSERAIFTIHPYSLDT